MAGLVVFKLEIDKIEVCDIHFYSGPMNTTGMLCVAL